MGSLPTGMIWEVREREAEKPDLTSLLQAAAILTKAWASWTQFFFFFLSRLSLAKSIQVCFPRV